jgi:hypothetical protein
MYYNPGYAGDGNDIEAKAIRREQWLGFDGRPQVTNLNIDAPFKLFGMNHGAGISIQQDIIGFFENLSMNISYAYRKPLTMGELGIGFGGNFSNIALGDKLNWRYPDEIQEHRLTIRVFHKIPKTNHGLSMEILVYFTVLIIYS